MFVFVCKGTSASMHFLEQLVINKLVVNEHYYTLIRVLKKIFREFPEG